MKTINMGSAVDDRGKVTFVNEFPEGIKRMYIVENFQKDFIRAWHGHKKEAKYVFVIKGASIVGTVDMESEEVERFVLSDQKSQMLYIPPGYYNGFKTLTDDTVVGFLSTTTLEEAKEDDFRKDADTWDIWEVKPR